MMVKINIILYIHSVFPQFPAVPGLVPRIYCYISTSSRVPSFPLRNEFSKKLEIPFLLIKTTTYIKCIYYFFTRGIPRELGNSSASLVVSGLRVPKCAGTIGNWLKSDHCTYCVDAGGLC
nr:MAG TPA: hypothetical protein [Caudoviricetes sp.]